jgi:hypothetical protein
MSHHFRQPWIVFKKLMKFNVGTIYGFKVGVIENYFRIFIH